MRLTRAVIAMFALAAVGALALAVPTVRDHLAALGEKADGVVGVRAPEFDLAAQQAPPPPSLRTGTVVIDTTTVFFGWALLDRTTGQVTGSTNYQTGTNTTESMIKAWIVSDYLRTQTRPATPSSTSCAWRSSTATTTWHRSTTRSTVVPPRSSA